MITPSLQTEAQFQQMIVDRARARGWLVHHDRRQDIGIGGDAGFPDLVLAKAGLVLFIEVKTERGRVSESQTRWLDELCPTRDFAGWAVDEIPTFVARPSDWPWLQNVIDTGALP